MNSHDGLIGADTHFQFELVKTRMLGVAGGIRGGMGGCQFARGTPYSANKGTV